MDNSRTPEPYSEGAPSVIKFTSLAEALQFLHHLRKSNEALYCITLKDDLFFVAPFGLGYQLIEEGYRLVYGG